MAGRTRSPVLRRIAALVAVVAAGCAAPVPDDQLAAAGKGEEAALPIADTTFELPDDLMANLVVPHPAPAPTPPAVRRRVAPPRASRAATRPRVVQGDVWGALARCESGGNPGAHSSTGKYHGAFQFSLATWQSLGYGGDPHNYPFEVQLEAAKKLQARSGWGQWPRCARKLGLI